MTPPRRGFGVAALMLALVGCGGEPRQPASASPEYAALQLFRLARTGEPDSAALTRRFAAPPRDEPERASLLDALETLGRVPPPRVVEVWRPEDGDAFVDLEADLPGGGVARYSVRLGEMSPEGWRVRWFRGPDAAWPEWRRGPDEGLSISAPPTPDALESDR